MNEIATVKESSEPGEIVVIANSSSGVQNSLAALSLQMDKRIAHWQAEKATLEKNLALAIKNKLRQSIVKNHVAAAQRRIEFYTKLKAAFDAGYVPIPNFNGVDVFAVRVKKNKPHPEKHSGRASYGGPSIPGVTTDAPPVGEGKFVDSTPFTEESRWTENKQLDGGRIEKIEMMTRWASSFDDEIDFPFILTKPEIVEGTGRAVADRIFDELCVSPGVGNTGRQGDPMVIGRVVLKNGPRHGWRRVSFLIGWYIDTKDL